jgi:hypothetical protein
MPGVPIRVRQRPLTAANGDDPATNVVSSSEPDEPPVIREYKVSPPIMGMSPYGRHACMENQVASPIWVGNSSHDIQLLPYGHMVQLN